MLNSKTEQNKIYEFIIRGFSKRFKILYSFSEKTYNKYLIDEETIISCQKIPKDYRIGEFIITTILYTTIEKIETEIISEELHVTIWVIFMNINMKEE